MHSATEKQKIVLVINSLQGGGAEKYVLTLGDSFAKLGYEVHLLCFDPKIEHIVPPSLIYHLLPFTSYKWLKKGRIRHFFFAKAVDKFIQQHIGKPAFILVNLYRAYDIFYYSRLSNIAYVIHNQLTAKLQLTTRSQRDFANIKRIYTKYPAICVSQGVEQDFIKQFGRQANTITIYNPIDRDTIMAQADEPLSILSQIPPDYLVHIGSFKAQKGHEVLLQAYAKSDQILPLVLVGQGALQPQIEQLIVGLNLQEKVSMVGFQANPYPLLKNATGFVLSSHFEGFALVLAEALALGVPAISTDCPSGPSEILPAYHLVPVGDVTALANKLNALMKNPEQFIAPFNEKFLPTNVARQYLHFMNIS